MIVKILLISLAVVQLAGAKPAPVDEDVCLMKAQFEEWQPSEEDEASTQLIKFMSFGMAKTLQGYVQGFKAVSEQLLQNEEILNSKSTKVLEFKQNLTKFKENYAECDGLKALSRLAASSMDITLIYFINAETTFDNDAKFILPLLSKFRKWDIPTEELKKRANKVFAGMTQKFKKIKEQLARAKPTPVDEDVCFVNAQFEEWQPSEKDKDLLESSQLLKFAILATGQITKKYIQGAKAVSEQLLQSEEIHNSKSAKVLEFKQNFTRFEENYAECNGVANLYELADYYWDITSSYFNDDETTFDNDAKFILSLLRKYNSDELEREYYKHFDIFLADLDKLYASLKGQVAREGGKQGQKLAEWFAQLKTLKSYEEKFDAYDKFNSFYF